MQNLKDSTEDGDGHEAPFETMEYKYEPHQEYHLDENGNLIYN